MPVCDIDALVVAARRSMPASVEQPPIRLSAEAPALVSGGRRKPLATVDSVGRRSARHHLLGLVRTLEFDETVLRQQRLLRALVLEQCAAGPRPQRRNALSGPVSPV